MFNRVAVIVQAAVVVGVCGWLSARTEPVGSPKAPANEKTEAKADVKAELIEADRASRRPRPRRGSTGG